jgi:hypothetical protein
MAQQSAERSESRWKEARLRLTGFLSPAAPIHEPDWWKSLTGESPERRVSQPKIGVLQEDGPFMGGKLILAAQPTRIDWVLTQSDPTDLSSSVGPIGEFKQLMLKWLESCPPVQRIAWGPILHIPTDDRIRGYQLLSEYLHSVRLDAENSTDFFYQINRPRTVTFDSLDIKINRLSKWSVATLQQALLSVGPEAATYALGPGQILCQLELDVNTDQEFQGNLPHEQLPQILDCLCEFGEEIARQGDIP